MSTKLRPLIVAHRGASAEAPENTLAAFRLALQQGCDAIELDIHLSADEQIIVCHDETLERTTDGEGAIEQLTVAELKRHDAGRWFGTAFAGERLPLLDEVLDLVPPEISLNIEIKGYPHPNIVSRTVELVRSRNRMDSVFFSSFGLESMVALKRLAPDARIGLLYDEQPIDFEAFFREHQVQGYALHPDHRMVNRNYVDEAARNGLQVFPWTVDDPLRMRQLVEWGVSGIITNRPAVMRQLLTDLGKLG